MAMTTMIQRNRVQSGCSPGCSFDLPHLSKRALDLIDPPQSSTIAGEDSRSRHDNDDGDVISMAQAIHASTTVGSFREPMMPDVGTKSSHTSSRKVRFSTSCAPPRKSISAGDAIQAYDMLIRAASTMSSSPSQTADSLGGINDINAATSWETLQHVADVYRALLVTSCLLVELLPPDSSENDDKVGNRQHHAQSTSSWEHACPASSASDPTCIPALSSAIEKRIISTSRRCILLLQALERICAAKTIAQRHSAHRSQTQFIGSTAMTGNKSLLQSSFCAGGDDIHDYDRNDSDLCRNYDWHDDGFLPIPFSSAYHDDEMDPERKEDDIDSGPSNMKKRSKQSSNILQECCYRPQHPTDPPSSKFEKIAWTRDWIRGERIISLRLKDYHCCNENDSRQANAVVNETICNLGVAEPDEVGCSEEPDNGIDDQDNIILDISPDALAEEEDCLMDIMFPCKMIVSSKTQPPDTQHSNKKKNARERRKRKRHRQKSTQHLAKLDSTDGGLSQPGQSVQVKEGFLLLVCEDYPNTITNALGDCRKSNSHQRNNSPKSSIRVYVRLQPSGLLTIEDCSIRSRSYSGDDMTHQHQPLPPRVRYWNFSIGPKTHCEPCMPEGADTFHFQLNCVRILGSSSLNQSIGNVNDSNHKKKRTPPKSENDSFALNDTANLLFRVDEETGGAFVNGYEWANALSGAVDTATLLQESIHAAWGEHRGVSSEE